MGDIQLPNMPDVTGSAIDSDPQLRALLIAIKQTIDKLTGADPKSNSALIDLLNDNQ
jgi:hypothetical protein